MTPTISPTVDRLNGAHRAKRSYRHFFLLAGTCALIGLFAWRQNQGGRVGGPISPAKILWLNFTLITFLLLPFCLWRNLSLSRAVRRIFCWVFFSFALRGVIELFILYCTHGWKCIYGISHDLATFSLVIWLRHHLPQIQNVNDRRALGFTSILQVTLLVEAFMAWQFSLVASPRDGIYFAADTGHFRSINNMTWITVSILYPLQGYFIWCSRRDFSRA
jgi:hypothetical protein